MADLFFDVETIPFSAGNMCPPLVCITYAIDNDEPTILLDTQLPEFLDMVDNNPSLRLVAHNAGFDMTVLANSGAGLEWAFRMYENRRAVCTKVASRMYDLAIRGYLTAYSLEELSKRWLGVDGIEGKKTIQKRFGEVRGVPVAEWPSEFKDYAKGDITHLRDIYRTAMRAPSPNLFEQVRAGFDLALVGIYGLRGDPDRIETLLRALVERKEAAFKVLKAAGYTNLDGIKEKLLRERVLELYPEAPLTEVTEKGGGGIVSLKETTMTLVYHMTGDPVFKAHVDYKSASKTLNTFGRFLEESAYQSIHPYWESPMLTGRVSASKPPITNAPREGGVRECFVPYPGNTFIFADYSNAELVSLAQVNYTLFGFSEMRRLINEGYDLHLFYGSHFVREDVNHPLHGLSYEQLVALREKGDKRVADLRQMMKPGNFGFPGGMGLDMFIESAIESYGVVISREVAAAMKRIWFGVYPEMRSYFAYHQRLQKEAGGDKYPITQLFTGRKRANCTYSEGANSMFQGLTSDCFKEALRLITEACWRHENHVMYGCRVVNAPHDEIVIEVPNHRVSEVAPAFKRLMLQGAERYIKDVKVTVDLSTADRLTKKGKVLHC